MKNRFLTILKTALIGFAFIPSFSNAAIEIVGGPEARITAIDTNWGNEGRFAVFIEGSATTCSGWVHFHDIYLQHSHPDSTVDSHQLNFSLATAAMITKKRIRIMALSENCWEAIGIVVYNN